MTARDLLDDPDFAGLVFQHWHVTGDERQPWGSAQYAPRTVGEDLIDFWLQRESDEFSVRPVRWHRLPCEVCGGTGAVQAHQNGRTGTHPCPRGCDIIPSTIAEAANGRLRRALALMMEVQSLRRRPLGEPFEGIAWKAANAMALAREAMGGDGEADLPAALSDDEALRRELIALGWTPPATSTDSLTKGAPDG